MPSVYVFHNKSNRGRLSDPGLKQSDLLTCVVRHEFRAPFVSDIDALRLTVAGCNTGSGKEFPEFTTSSVRSLMPGDVITIARDEDRRSYEVEEFGFRRMVAPVVNTGYYFDPSYIHTERLAQDEQRTA
jgi:hypothetical protein